MKTHLILHCGGAHDAFKPTDCKESVVIDWWLLRDHDLLSSELSKRKWLLALASPPRNPNVELHPMCFSCAEKIMPEVMDAFRKSRPS